jgi:hypothetical protein
MKKIIIILLVLIVALLAYIAFKPKNTGNTSDVRTSEKDKEINITSDQVTPHFVSESPAIGKYQFVADYKVKVCVTPIDGDFPRCKNDVFKESVLFKKGDVVYSYRAFYDDKGTGWGIGLDGSQYGGSNARIDMIYVIKVPDSTPEKNSFK